MILKLFLFTPIFMFLLSCLVFISNRKHLLITLLSLEFIVLTLFMFLFIFFSMNNASEMYFLMVFLVFSVCEGALGLSILVSMIRTHGNNYFQSFNSLLC
nr:TPA_asm: NADH dehydrogenase subunit 4L [Trichosia splendens]